MRRAVVLLLPTIGCVVGPSYTPQISVPKAWNEGVATAGRVDRRVARTLVDGVPGPAPRPPRERAIDGNLDLKIAAARVREARAARGIAACAGLPQVEPTQSTRAATVTRSARANGTCSKWASTRAGRSTSSAACGETWRRRWPTSRPPRKADARSWSPCSPTSAATTSSCAARSNSSTSSRDASRGAGHPRHREGAVRRRVRCRTRRRPRRRPPECERADRPVLERLMREAIYRLGVLVGKEPGALATVLETPKALPPVPPGSPDAALRTPLPSTGPSARRARGRRGHRAHRRRPRGPLPSILDPRQLRTTLALATDRYTAVSRTSSRSSTPSARSTPRKTSSCAARRALQSR